MRASQIHSMRWRTAFFTSMIMVLVLSTVWGAITHIIAKGGSSDADITIALFDGIMPYIIGGAIFGTVVLSKDLSKYFMKKHMPSAQALIEKDLRDPIVYIRVREEVENRAQKGEVTSKLIHDLAVLAERVGPFLTLSLDESSRRKIALESISSITSENAIVLLNENSICEISLVDLANPKGIVKLCVARHWKRLLLSVPQNMDENNPELHSAIKTVNKQTSYPLPKNLNPGDLLYYQYDKGFIHVRSREDYINRHLTMEPFADPMPNIECEDWNYALTKWYDKSRVVIIDLFDVPLIIEDITKLAELNKLEKLVIWMPPLDPKTASDIDKVRDAVFDLLGFISGKSIEDRTLWIGGFVSFEDETLKCHKTFSDYCANQGIQIPSVRRIKWQGRMPWAGPTIFHMDERPRTKRSWLYIFLAPILGLIIYLGMIGLIFLPGADFFYWTSVFITPVIILTVLANLRRRIGAHGQPFGFLTALILILTILPVCMVIYWFIDSLDYDAAPPVGDIIYTLLYLFWVPALIWVYDVPKEEGLGIKEAQAFTS